MDQVIASSKGYGLTAKRQFSPPTRDEGRFQAWWKLRMRFEPTLTVKQSFVLAEFSGMVASVRPHQGMLVTMMRPTWTIRFGWLKS